MRQEAVDCRIQVECQRLIHSLPRDQAISIRPTVAIGQRRGGFPQPPTIRRRHDDPLAVDGRRITTTTKVTTVSGTTKPSITPEKVCNASCCCAARMR